MSSRLFPVAAVIDIEDTLPAVGSIYGLDPFMDYHLGAVGERYQIATTV